MVVKFGTLGIGDKFEVYGDYILGYNYPKICRCIKEGDIQAKEIDGSYFYMDPNDDVFIGEDSGFQ